MAEISGGDGTNDLAMVYVVSSLYQRVDPLDRLQRQVGNQSAIHASNSNYLQCVRGRALKAAAKKGR